MVRNRESWAWDDDLSDGSWPSSEFEDDDEEEEGYLAEAEIPAPNKPLPRTPGDSLPRFPGLHRRKQQNNAKTPTEEADDDTVCLPVYINVSKHPPPELPPAPPGLSETQVSNACSGIEILG
jgi:hypothetical protein